MVKPGQLTYKQQLFATEYLINGGNATQAARKAGYKGDDNAMSQRGHELVSNSKIQAIIKAKQAKIQQKCEINAEELTKRFDSLAQKAESNGNIKEARLNNHELGQHIGYYEADNLQKQAPIQLIIDLSSRLPDTCVKQIDAQEVSLRLPAEVKEQVV